MSMNRRRFCHAAGAAALAGGCTVTKTGDTRNAGSGKRALMKLGCQRGPTDDRFLSFAARHSVEGVCGRPESTGDRTWKLDDLLAMRERCDKHGISLDLLEFPLSSAGIERQIFPNILLGRNPERDRDIDLLCDMIRVAAQAGIPCLKYNMALHKVLRTDPTPGRGGSSYSTWNYALAKDKNQPHPVAGTVPREVFWERITYFLERVIPVAEEYKIRMACHQHDPGVPEQGFRGIYRVLGDIDGLKRFISIKESPYHGFNFCLGTVSEMLQNPAAELCDIIRYFGSRQKIFNIHYRNIQGKRDDFREVYLDNGDVDMLQVMRTLKEVEYPYLVMPDHVPRHPDDADQEQAFAFSYGYIRAMIQVVKSEG